MSRDTLSKDELEALTSSPNNLQQNGIERAMRIRVVGITLVALYFLCVGLLFPQVMARQFNFDAMYFPEARFYEMIPYRTSFTVLLVVLYNYAFWKRWNFFHVAIVTLVAVSFLFAYDFENFYLFTKPEFVVRASILAGIRLLVIIALLQNVIDASKR